MAMPAVAVAAERMVGARVTRSERVMIAVTGSTWRLTLQDGRELFAKDQPTAAPGFVAAEVAGLRWLAAAPGGPPVPEVIAADDHLLLLPWLTGTRPRAEPAAELGRRLAALHTAGADSYGAPWPGWIGRLPMDNRPLGDWPAFFAERRLRPYLRMLVDDGLVAGADAAVLDRVCDRLPALAGPAEPVARLHGDLWSGNVRWAAPDGRAWLIDPAAHGGHRETDLAMLALFPPERLSRILGGYQEVAPLADGWAERVQLHQLHPLLVHAVLWPGSYLDRTLQVARRYAG
jgi:fructosamine-3-kinase